MFFFAFGNAQLGSKLGVLCFLLLKIDVEIGKSIFLVQSKQNLEQTNYVLGDD
jgi:hypothetical protein